MYEQLFLQTADAIFEEALQNNEKLHV